MPIAVSVQHLRDIISDRLIKKFPGEEKEIPSLEWIRYQFWPRNPYSSSALRYTGRFAIKFGVKCRQMRKSHPDAHYVNALLQYVKGFVVQFRNFCQYISADDKAIIPVGEPDLPISTGVRGHNRSLVFAHGSRLEALDHDCHLLHSLWMHLMMYMETSTVERFLLPARIKLLNSPVPSDMLQS